MHLFVHKLQFDSQVQDTLKTEISDMIEKVNNPSMKEVKGLEDRLYGLDQIMFGARKIVQEQADMAQVGLSVRPKK